MARNYGIIKTNIMKKPFKETKLGKLLASKGLDVVLGTVGDIVPGVKILDQIKDIITGQDPSLNDQPALQALTPEDRAQILEMIKLEQDELEVYLADVQNARAMQIEALHQDDLFSKRFVYYFISAWSLFSMLFIGFTTVAPIPAENMRIVDTTQGFILGTAIASMFAFLLGSTRRSEQKDSTIAKLTKQ